MVAGYFDGGAVSCDFFFFFFLFLVWTMSWEAKKIDCLTLVVVEYRVDRIS